MSTQPSTPAPLFTPRQPERAEKNFLPWIIAGVVVLLGLGAVLLATRSKPVATNTVQPLDPYASSLVFSGIQMSESSAISNVKVMYIDGRVKNTGAQTVTSATVQVLFANDEQLPPQVETVPLTLIRTHEPYVDTQPLSAAPLAPGDEREFRLIFDNIGANWNQQLPQIHVTRVGTR